MAVIFNRQPKDPNEHVRATLAVLAQQHQENHQRGVGLSNMPRHQRAKQDLARIGSEAVPALVQALASPRASTDTPQGQVEVGVACDIAEILGDIGDPRAVKPLMAQFKHYIVSAQSALGKFPQGVDALLGGLDDDDEFIRGCCIQGLGLAQVERARAAQGITRALDDPHAQNRWTAALAAWHLGMAAPELMEALRRRAAADDSDRVRGKADDALGVLSQR